MHIDSARALKASLLSEARALPPATRGLRRLSATEATLAAPPPMAIGIVPRTRSDVRLAVRLRERSAAAQRWVEEIERRSAGEVEVRLVGRISSLARRARPRLWQRGRHRPLEPGTSVGHYRVTCGSLGAFVRDAQDRLCMLSNNHVLANEDDARVDDAILQPGSDDGGAGEDRVASLLRWPRLRRRGANQIDAALGWVEEEQDLVGNVWHGLGRLAGTLGTDELRQGRPTVAKLGRTTGLTRGRITAIELDEVRIEYDSGLIRFDDQIEIEGSGRAAFCDGGDSGSLVLASDRRAIGLLFAGSEEGGANNRGLTYVNPIETVLAILGADFDI